MINRPKIKGTRLIARDALASLPTPAGTWSHRPVPHAEVLDLACSTLEQQGYASQLRSLSVSDDNSRMFAELHINVGITADNSVPGQFAVGVRNSHDKAFAAGFALGRHVTVCSNLDFSAEIVVARKHTRHIMRQLPDLMHKAVGRLPGFVEKSRWHIDQMRGRTLTEFGRDHYLVKLVREGVVPGGKLLDVLRAYEQPTHVEYGHNSVWTLHSACTEVLGGRAIQPDTYMRKTVALNRVLSTAHA